MKKSNLAIIAIIVLICLFVGFKIGEYLGVKTLEKKWGGEGLLLEEGETKIMGDYNKIRLSHFGIGAGDYIEMLPELGAHWARLPLDVDSLGSDVERIDWALIDEKARKANNQKVLLYGSFNRGGRVEDEKQTWPKAEIFAMYFEKAVERYDGDGIEDMPGLRYPIKNWEILNEVPSVPNQDATPEIYADYLGKSYKALKQACSDCNLATGGIPGPIAQEFLEDTINYNPEVRNYFDILSWHTYSAPFKEKRLSFLEGWEEEYGLEGKEVWYPELGVYNSEINEKAADLVKSYVYRFSKGMEVGIFVEVGPHGRGEDGGGLIDKIGGKLPVYHAYKTLTSKIDYFTDVKTMKEIWQEIGDGEFSELGTGYYKFIVGGKQVYVLWCSSGDCEIPLEIEGQIKVTDINGNGRVTSSSELILGNSPVFVERQP